MIIALTGAGISSASGVPTFQEQPDIREKLSRHFAQRCPEEFQKLINGMTETCRNATPNDAHKALAEHGIPIITMNVDGLHNRAGSKHVIPVHGELESNNVVLYGDPAPRYSDAKDWLYRLGRKDALLVIGTSYYTNFPADARKIAADGGAMVIEINSDAETQVRRVLESIAWLRSDFEEFMSREENGEPIPPPYAGGWTQP